MIYVGIIYCFAVMVVVLIGLLASIITDGKQVAERVAGLAFLPAVMYIFVLLIRAWP